MKGLLPLTFQRQHAFAGPTFFLFVRFSFWFKVAHFIKNTMLFFFFLIVPCNFPHSGSAFLKGERI